MNISSAIFDRSAPDLDSCPDESLPEFAFIGRSNVGKSSLLNMLAGRDGLARVSPVPGFTKLINFFTMNRTWRLVDLPGYGFAQVAREDRSAFNESVADYLSRRANLNCVFLLIDSGLPPQKIDLEFVQWLAGHAIPFVFVFTKSDRSKPEEVQANIAAFMAAIAGWFVQLPEFFISSATTGRGRSDLLGMIGESLAVLAAQERETAARAGLPAPSRKAKQAPKKRPDLKRPW